jgi:prevent-host-death family protein
MCYIMPDHRVGVRELRQNLSKYLRRVLSGETLEVTERGKPVAVLSPLPEEATALDRLAALGRLRRARLDLNGLGPPLDYPLDMSISGALQEQKAERLE